MLKNVPLKMSVLLWFVLTLFVLTQLSGFDGAAGVSGHAPPHWNDSAPIALDKEKPTLIMLVHPQCPCSRASLYELNRLAALCPHRAALNVLFLKPAGCSLAWTKTELWRSASAIPGVSVRVDEHGDMARRLGAATSGEAVLYAPDGRLLYQGGLTGERGHEGDNAALAALADLLHRTPPGAPLKLETSKPTTEPVYGCPLTADRRDTASKGVSWLP